MKFTMIRCGVATIAMLAILCGRANSFDSEGIYTSYDSTSCGRLIQIINDERSERLRYKGTVDPFAMLTGYYAKKVGWLAGYLTAVNTYMPGGKNHVNTDLESAMLFVEKYCRENPLSDFATAAAKLVNQAAPNLWKNGR